MNRRDFLIQSASMGLGLGLLGKHLPVLAEGQNDNGSGIGSQPNFIFIFADDLGWGDLGCYGHPVLRTPNMDRLAAEGCRFTEFYVTSPICAASRAGVLTGRDQNRFGLKHILNSGGAPRVIPLYHHLPPEEPTLPGQLQRAGYRTGHIGKFHLSMLGQKGEPWPDQYGFDHYFVAEGGGSGIYRNPSNWIRNGEMQKGKLAEWTTDLYIEESIRFIEQSEGQPFYLQLWPFTPHEPVDCAERYKEMYSGRTKIEQEYFGCITQLDDALGRLFDYLTRNGLDKNTVLVLSSDNGPENPLFGYEVASSTGGLRGSKHTIYEGGIRVPGIVRWPGLTRPGTVSNVPVSTLDLFPTFCAAAGVELPENLLLDGGDFRPAIEGNPVQRPHSLYWQFEINRFWQHTGEEYIGPQLAIRKDYWKLLINDIFSREDPRWHTAEQRRFFRASKDLPAELYNLDTDPGERWNLAEVYPEIAQDMLQEMEAVYLDVNAPYPREKYLNPEIPNPRMLQDRNR